jgi:uncharacterized C2H2 Zn-finger protein
MARARRQPSQSKSETFKCPECGRTFSRAAALGAHRRRAHGVVGATSKARVTSSTRSGAVASSKNVARATATSSAANGRRQSRSPARASAAQVNRDALLQAIFPGGVPAREAVIRAANAWLDEAERLARLK